MTTKHSERNTENNKKESTENIALAAARGICSKLKAAC